MAPRVRKLLRIVVVVLAVSISIASFYMFGGRYSEYSQEAFARTCGDVMAWRSRSLAGRNAVNCGIVPARGNPDAATDCALKAFASHKAFRVRYGLQTYDTAMAAGVVTAPDGHAYELIFSGGTPTGITDIFRQRVATHLCAVPTYLRRTPKGRISCFDPDAHTPMNWISSWLWDAP